MPSNQMSPSTAVRSIFADLLQQYTPSSSPHSKTNKRKRIEGKYGEEITSSGRLDELKQKASKPNPKKRLFKSTEQISTSFVTGSAADSRTTTTTTKRRKLSKQTSEMITSSQATRAIATLQNSSSMNMISDQNDISSPLQNRQ
jgi:hypothetical protein